MDIICFSHLRWNFVHQRPQHLLSRFTKEQRVFYVEEYITSSDPDGYTISSPQENLFVVIPHLKKSQGSNTDENYRVEKIVSKLFNDNKIESPIFWYYTPMALNFTQNFTPRIIVYDCMDELSNFKFAPPTLKKLEARLFEIADLVFTGGNTLYEAKKHLHNNIYSFPSSIDKEHFELSRTALKQFPDQANIPSPRLGFYGVIDERFDIELIREAAELKPDWHFVLIGPVIKIDPATLPKNSNIHYLGPKEYSELPTYLAGWDIALIPFAINDSTRFISPTKTPEYLAGGKPVISTPITDVVYPYGKLNLVHIVENGLELVEKANRELHSRTRQVWLKKVDNFLSNISWDHTWSAMNDLIMTELMKLESINPKTESYVRLLDSGGRTGWVSSGRAAV